jgi:hypothetical protein
LTDKPKTIDYLADKLGWPTPVLEKGPVDLKSWLLLLGWNPHFFNITTRFPKSKCWGQSIRIKYQADVVSLLRLLLLSRIESSTHMHNVQKGHRSPLLYRSAPGFAGHGVQETACLIPKSQL